jgi:hypothetical protein
VAKVKANANKKRDVLAELFEKRDSNIKTATSWPAWEIEDVLKRAQSAKEGFLMDDPMHDLSIIEEQISQLTESLKIKSAVEADL